MVHSFPSSQVSIEKTQEKSLVVEYNAGSKMRYHIRKDKVLPPLFDNGVTADIDDADYEQLLSVKNN
jgi:hypothetical protein